MKQIYLFIAFIILSQTTFAQEAAVKLFPNGVPNSKQSPDYKETIVNGRTRMVTDPELLPFFPEKGKANGTAVIICPGGSYIQLAINSEAVAAAKKFNEIGVTAFVLKYRLPSDVIMVDKSMGPLQDAQRSIQLLRQRATELGINPAKVGIVGFSSGGHVASSAGTHFEKAVIDNKDNISLRPDFMMLLYPVISMGEYAHKTSVQNLLGANPSQELIDLYSNQKQIKPNTPITFMVHAEDDPVVPVQNTLMFYNALLANKVQARLIIYPHGGHGFGLVNRTTKDYWFNSATNWLDANGFLTK
jgi:acetyl esterase/lipase